MSRSRLRDTVETTPRCPLPPGLKVLRPPLVRLRYGLVTRRHPYNGVVGRLQNYGFPTDPATQATGLRLLPRWDCLPQNAPAFAGRATTAFCRDPVPNC